MKRRQKSEGGDPTVMMIDLNAVEEARRNSPTPRPPITMIALKCMSSKSVSQAEQFHCNVNGMSTLSS